MMQFPLGPIQGTRSSILLIAIFFKKGPRNHHVVGSTAQYYTGAVFTTKKVPLLPSALVRFSAKQLSLPPHTMQISIANWHHFIVV